MSKDDANQEATAQEMEEYLVSWYWEKEAHPDRGFDVWFHHKFPRYKYKLEAAYRKMKSVEPSMEPVLTVQKNDPDGARKLNEFFEARGIGLRFKTVVKDGNE